MRATGTPHPPWEPQESYTPHESHRNPHSPHKSHGDPHTPTREPRGPPPSTREPREPIRPETCGFSDCDPRVAGGFSAQRLVLRVGGGCGSWSGLAGKGSLPAPCPSLSPHRRPTSWARSAGRSRRRPSRWCGSSCITAGWCPSSAPSPAPRSAGPSECQLGLRPSGVLACRGAGRGPRELEGATRTSPTLWLFHNCAFRPGNEVGGAGERGAGCLGEAQFQGRGCGVSKKPASGAGSLLPRACHCSGRWALLGPTAQKDPYMSVEMWRRHPLPLGLS